MEKGGIHLKRKWIALLPTLLLLIGLTGCQTYYLEIPSDEPEVDISAPNGEDIPVFDREYYADLTPNEYITYLKRIFISALYDMPRAGELGLSNYAEVLCANGNYAMGYPADEITYNTLVRTETPVFYGLLAETETYLRNHGVSYDYLASPYGKAHALRGVDVQAMINLLMRKDVLLSFSSVAGAEYVEEANLFVYDELIDPLREYTDRGWSFEIAGINVQDDSKWEEAYTSATGGDLLFLYDKATGILYDLYGEEVLGRTYAIDYLREFYYPIMLDMCGPEPRLADHIWRGSNIIIDYNRSAQYEITLDTPIQYVMLGRKNKTLGYGYTTEAELIQTLENLRKNGYMEEADNALQEMRESGYFPGERVRELESTFFDDYYRDPNAGSRVTNYFLASFYECPEEIDISFLPTQDQDQLAEWCEIYLDITMEELREDPATVGTAQCDWPAVGFSYGSAVGSGGDPYGSGEPYQYVTIYYYNEMLRQTAVMTLRILEDGWQFVSNLPAEREYFP